MNTADPLQRAGFDLDAIEAKYAPYCEYCREQGEREPHQCMNSRTGCPEVLSLVAEARLARALLRADVTRYKQARVGTEESDAARMAYREFLAAKILDKRNADGS